MTHTVVEETTQLAVAEKAKLKKVFRRLDMLLFTVCALVGMDSIGTIAGYGIESVTWLVVLAAAFLIPYALIMSELGTSLPEEGGPYEWVKLAFGRIPAGIFAVLYWITNPFWVGGSLAFTAVGAIDAQWFHVETGSFTDYLLKTVFVWFSIVVAIMSFDKGKWIPNAGAIARVILVLTFLVTTAIYAVKNGVHGVDFGGLSPTVAGFLSIVPIAIFSFVGFELQTNASEEMVDPQRDIPVSVSRSGVLAAISYILPVLGVLFVLPGEEIDGLSGFVNAAETAYADVWGAAGPVLMHLTVALLVLALATSGAVWMIGSDRTQAVAAMDGAFFPYFGRLHPTLGTPVRVNVLSGIASTIFAVLATWIAVSGSSSAAAAFGVVFTVAISTTLLSYLFVFPAAIALRYKMSHIPRVFSVPGGNAGMWVAVIVTTGFCLVGSIEAVLPGLLWKVVGVDYGSFFDAWGVSRWRFEVLTLGSLVVVVVLALVGYAAGSGVRRQSVDVVLAEETV